MHCDVVAVDKGLTQFQFSFIKDCESLMKENWHKPIILLMTIRKFGKAGNFTFLSIRVGRIVVPILERVFNLYG